MPWSKVDQGALNRLKEGKKEMNEAEAKAKGMFPGPAPKTPGKPMPQTIPPGNPPNSSHPNLPGFNDALANLQGKVNRIHTARAKGGRKTRCVKHRKAKKTRRH